MTVPTLGSPATAPARDLPARVVGEALTYRDVGKRFGERWVVRGLDLTIETGTIVGLIGPSGCGKTTTIRLATGVYRPDEGEVRLLGRTPHEMTTAERILIGYLPQEPVLFEELSLRENLNFHASLNGLRFRRRSRLKELMELVDLRGEERKLVGQASGGMKRRLALAATLAHRPPVLMLDEPTAGIDPILRRRFWEHFRQLRDAGHTIVVATQYVGEAADCDQVVLLNEGRAVASGSPAEVRRAAVGGDLVDIETSEPLPAPTLERLSRLEPVRHVEATGLRRTRLRVDDAASALPLLMDTVQQEGLEVVASEEVLVSYDEVFIALVERDGQPASGGAVNPILR